MQGGFQGGGKGRESKGALLPANKAGLSGTSLALFVKEMLTVKPNPYKKNWRDLFLKILFAVGMLSFLIYGLSPFFAQPTVETVVTPAARRGNANKQPTENIKAMPK